MMNDGCWLNQTDINAHTGDISNCTVYYKNLQNFHCNYIITTFIVEFTVMLNIYPFTFIYLSNNMDYTFSTQCNYH